MTDTYSGSCQCGAVKYEVTGEFQRFFLCHCQRCRKDTGSAHGANIFLSPAEITWASGEDKVKTYLVPGTRHSKSFCTECGSALPRVPAGANMIVIPAGSLDSAVDAEIRPLGHIFLQFKADWDDHLDEVPKFDGLPG